MTAETIVAGAGRSVIEIESNIIFGGKFPEFDTETIRNEPMIFNGSPDFSYKSGGPITRAFLTALDNDWDSKDHPTPVVFDSRVHMLMPGWFPCIPGWHHDDVPRTRSDRQPDYDTPPYRSLHCMGLVNGSIAPTEFAIGTAEYDIIQPGAGPIYKHWHNTVETHIAEGRLKRLKAPTSRLIWFNDRAFHQGTAAVKGGWRWFGRMSYSTHRKPSNEIRRQVQVYLAAPMEGW